MELIFILYERVFSSYMYALVNNWLRRRRRAISHFMNPCIIMLEMQNVINSSERPTILFQRRSTYHQQLLAERAEQYTWVFSS